MRLCRSGHKRPSPGWPSARRGGGGGPILCPCGPNAAGVAIACVSLGSRHSRETGPGVLLEERRWGALCYATVQVGSRFSLLAPSWPLRARPRPPISAPAPMRRRRYSRCRHPNKWEFSFTPYGWFSGINGNATARGHTVNVDESFIEILQDSDSVRRADGLFRGAQGTVQPVHRRGLGRSRLSRKLRLQAHARSPGFPSWSSGSEAQRSSTTKSSSSSLASVMSSPNGPTAAAPASLRSMSWAAPATGTSRPTSR